MPLSQTKRKLELGRLAKDMVVAKRGGDSSERAHKHVIERLGRLHGLPQKIGQILSLGELEEDGGDYTALTEAPPALPAEEAFALIEERLGGPIDEFFSDIDPEGISASLSQVHHATLLDGREVAVKIQFPDIENAVWHDLRALGWLTAPVGGLKRGFNLNAYQNEVRAILDEELDYIHEAQAIATMHKHAFGRPELRIPEAIPQLSGEHILTMTWMDGEPFEAARKWARHERQAIAEIFLRTFLDSCFNWGCLHGDPHPGNFKFRHGPAGPQLVMLDFGCVKPLPSAAAPALRWLIDATIEGTLDQQSDAVYTQYVAIGFDPIYLEPMAQRLPELTRLIFEPFTKDAPYDVKEWNMSERVGEILDDDRWNFRFAGPADLLVFIRAYQGILQYLSALNTPINWQELYRHATGSKATATSAAPAPRVVAPPRKSAGGKQAKVLHVRVSQNNQTKVAIKFKAEAAANIDELMPEDILEVAQEQGIDINSIRDNVIRDNFVPGDLFQLEKDGKTVRVWLQ